MSKNNKKTDLKSKSKCWSQCTKCSIFYFKPTPTTDHVCPEKLIDIFDLDASKDQLFMFKNLALLNTTETSKGKYKILI